MVTYNAEKAKRLRKLLLKAFFSKCWVKNCKEIENLEFAHIKATKLSGWGRGRWQRIYDIINNPCNYALLCHNHHIYFDNELIGVKDFVI